MDEVWTALALLAPLVMGLVWAIRSLAGCARRDRRQRAAHAFRGQGEAIMVAELLEDAAERGAGIRLNWPADDFHASPIRPDELGQFPTEVLPRIEEP